MVRKPLRGRIISVASSHIYTYIHTYKYNFINGRTNLGGIRPIVVHVAIRFRTWKFITRSHQTGSSKGRCICVAIYTVGISIVGISITERIFDENGCGIGWTALMNPQHRIMRSEIRETSVSKIIVPWYQMLTSMLTLIFFHLSYILKRMLIDWG